MSEIEETKWRLGAESEESHWIILWRRWKKEELQQTVQTNAEEIGGGGKEPSLLDQKIFYSITEAPKEKERYQKIMIIVTVSENKLIDN